MDGPLLEMHQPHAGFFLLMKLNISYTSINFLINFTKVILSFKSDLATDFTSPETKSINHHMEIFIVMLRYINNN